jgi:hypothetical protein
MHDLIDVDVLEETLDDIWDIYMIHCEGANGVPDDFTKLANEYYEILAPQVLHIMNGQPIASARLWVDRKNINRQRIVDGICEGNPDKKYVRDIAEMFVSAMYDAIAEITGNA